MADEFIRHLRLPDGRPRLLDVGCGEGDFLHEMQSLGWSVEGIDPSAEAVATARSRGVSASQATLSEVALAPHAFDAITFRLVLEHVREPRQALAECRRALKAGESCGSRHRASMPRRAASSDGTGFTSRRRDT